MISYLLQSERKRQKLTQEYLSKGICSVSYLSKIESGLTDASEEIITLLFEALGISYIHENEETIQFKQSFSKLEELFIEFEKEEFDQLFSELLEKAPKLLYSPCTIEAQILIAYRNKDIETLESIRTTKHKLLSFLQCELYEETLQFEDLIKLAEATLILDNSGTTAYYLMNAHFFLGNYHDCINFSKIAYSSYSMNGNAFGMFQAILIMAGSHSNINQLEQALDYYRVSERLGKQLQIDNYVYFSNYNIGATYLMMDNYDQALRHFKLAEKHVGCDEFRLYTKMILAYVMSGDSEKAEKYYTKIYKNQAGFNEDEYRFLKYIIQTEQFNKEKEYIEHLQRCMLYYESKRLFGHVRFYAKYLSEAYQSQARYKASLNLIKKYNVS
ncbi:helix-turn-helix transcriptional regulator [Erysipelothrix urinaevulpis]|uniref:helix-turn-helix domain-containing protein n=1 Tax=Erysipelothrix urinaevulpis TaxID=2683717 RepID=UPI001356CF4D|nr:helix-turn-helix transcriptional regulator [Erysipelothrix urinaevulpis]